MSADSNETAGIPPPGDDIPDPVERVLARCLELPEEQWSGAIEAACSEHPEQAAKIRKRVAFLRRSGLVAGADADDAEEAGDFPERLGEFQLLKELGGGGMGVIYRARQESTGDEVALKLVRPDQLYFPGSRKRFQRELATIGRLRHPGIVRVLAVGEEKGISYLAMERIRGCTLAQVLEELQETPAFEQSGRDLWDIVLEKSGRDPEAGEQVMPRIFRGSWSDACASLFLQIARALHHAHERGVIHRDVKPSNVMVTPEGKALLVDFGLARRQDVSRMTRTGVTLGSLPYMAPEQIRGERNIDARVDVYSLGVTLYELLALKAPYRSRDAEALRQEILHGDPTPVRTLNSAVPRDLEIVCLTAMDGEARRRYSSAEDLAEDLTHVLDGESIRARRASTSVRAVRYFRRHPILAAAAILLVLQVFVAQVLIYLNITGDRDDARQALHLAQQTNQQTETLHQRALAALEETRELLDASWLRSMPMEATSYYPVDETKAPYLEDWLARATELLDKRSDMEERLGQLEDQVETESGADQRVDLLESLRELRSSLGQLDIIERLHKRLSKDRELSSRVRWKTMDSPAAAALWEDAMDDIFLLEDYDGLELTPQVGLLPLGPDPDTGLWEFLHLPSGAPPVESEQHEARSRWQITPETGIILVLLPGGTFRMGAKPPDGLSPMGLPNIDPGASTFESPINLATLDAFLISKYELTQAQWFRLALENRNPSTIGYSDKEPSSRPVETVAWQDVERWLRSAGFELPTEAQWEYACRAGTGSVNFAGDKAASLFGFANFRDLSLLEPSMARRVPSQDLPDDDGFPRSAPVGAFWPNPYGLHDMLGNVSEMTRDGMEASYADLSARPGDGLRQGIEKRGWVLVRGGSWETDLKYLRSSARDFVQTHLRLPYTGLRVILPLEE